MVSVRGLVPLVACCALALTGCRSPFASQPEEGPDAGKVGRGIHGWPLLESAPHGPGWRTDVLWPAYSGITSEDDGLARTQVLLPLFLFESEGERRRTGVLRPVFDLETEGEEVYDLDLLWPIFKWKDTPDESEQRLFPVYFAHEDREHDEEALHVWPLYGYARDGTREQRWVLTPLFSHTTDAENDVSTYDAPWPLVHWGHEGDESEFRLLPLVWHRDAPDERLTVITPFFVNYEVPDESTFSMLFPFYGRYAAEDGDGAISIGGPLFIAGTEDEAQYTWVLAPLFRWHEEPDEWQTHLFPVLWLGREENGDGYTHVWPLAGWSKDGEERSVHVAAPLFGYEWDDDSWTLDLVWPLGELHRGPRSSRNRFWPLFSHRRSRNPEDFDEVRGNVGLFLANWETTSEDDSDFRILWKLVERTRHAGKETFVVNPLFRHETNEEGDEYWSFLFGLLARKQEAGEVDWRFLWVF